MLSSRRELQSYDIPPRQLRENLDQLENMGITRLKNNYRIGLSRELLLHSNQTMTLASVLSPPGRPGREWKCYHGRLVRPGGRLLQCRKGRQL